MGAARIRRILDLARFLFVQRVRGFNPPTEPHFDKQTKRFFEGKLSKSSFYLEFGAGGSTLLADRFGIPTISVEGDRYYAKAVRSALGPNTKVRIVTPDMGITGKWSMPLFGARRKGARYVEAPFAILENRFPDFVLIDGRYRIACALETARQAASRNAHTQILVDDYVERSHYHCLEQHIGKAATIGRAALFDIFPGSSAELHPAQFYSDAS